MLVAAPRRSYTVMDRHKCLFSVFLQPCCLLSPRGQNTCICMDFNKYCSDFALFMNSFFIGYVIGVRDFEHSSLDQVHTYERVNNVFVPSGDIVLTWQFVVTHIRHVVLVFGVVNLDSLR